MLETLVSMANFIKTTFYYVLYGSYKVGNVLVTCISALLYHLSKFTENLMEFFSVLCQSFSIFFHDNLQFLQELFTFAGRGFDSIYTTVYFMVSKITTLVSATVNLVVSSYVALWNLLITAWTSSLSLMVLLKKIIILFGSGVWFLITLVPLSLFYGCKLFITFIQTIYNETVDICSSGVSSVLALVKNIILFVFDVPLESLAGIIIFISFGVIIKQMYGIIAFNIKRKAREMINWYRRLQVNRSNNNVNHNSLHLEARRPLRSTSTTTRQNDTNNEQPRATAKPAHDPENYCVICHENIKCMLLLPCRHLCLCEGCLKRLKMYNKTCPICRADFTRTMKIYI